MRLLSKYIWKEELNYFSEKSVENFKKDIQQLFDNKKGRFSSVNLTGEFISEFEFKMTPKWQLVNIKNFETEISYLKGKIFSDENKKTTITFTVRPNSIFLIFFFLFPILGFLALTTRNLSGDINETRITGLLLTFAAPAIMLLFGHFAKQGIKERFIKTFNLKPVE